MTEKKIANRWERRFRRARNTALAIGGTAFTAYGGAALASYPERPASGFLKAALIAADAAFGLEAFRFAASPDSDKKRRGMNRIYKTAGAMYLYIASTWAIEGVSLVTNSTETVTLGAINMRNFAAQDRDWLPDSTGEIAGYAAADAAVAVIAAKAGISIIRRKEEPFQPPIDQIEV